MKDNDNKTKLKNDKYVIWDTHMDSITVNCLKDIRSFLKEDKTCKVDVDCINTKVVADEYCDRSFFVETTIDMLTVEKSLLVPANSLVLKLISMVSVDDSVRDERVIKTILSKKVPSDLFEIILTIISNTLNASAGYSLKMSKKKFMDSVQELEMKDREPYDVADWDYDDYNEDTDTCEDEDDEIIDYHQILKEMSKLAEAREFLDTYQTCVGPNVIDNYETLPAYKYYYRFFMPIEYHHPDIKGCDESVWPMLFQLLWGNMDAACRIVDRGNECPEIEVFYENYRCLVSELSKNDLKKLLDNLVTDMLTKDGVELISYKLINKYYGETINTSRRIFKSEFFYLYGYSDESDIPENEKEFLYSRYTKIKKCDIKTLIYRR